MKKSPKYRRNQSSNSLFENTQTLEALSKQGNPLEFISGMIDFEMFRPILEKQAANRRTQEQCRLSTSYNDSHLGFSTQYRYLSLFESYS